MFSDLSKKIYLDLEYHVTVMSFAQDYVCLFDNLNQSMCLSIYIY